MGCMDGSKQDEYFNEDGPLSQEFDETGTVLLVSTLYKNFL